jgi:hypothetical protein
MSALAVQVALVAVFALTCGALTVAWMRGRLGPAAIALFLVSCAIWALAFVLVITGWRGADSFATCDTDCSAIHYVTALAFLAPPLLIALSALGMIVARGARWRARRGAVDRNG